MVQTKKKDLTKVVIMQSARVFTRSLGLARSAVKPPSTPATGTEFVKVAEETRAVWLSDINPFCVDWEIWGRVEGGLFKHKKVH